jgi:hypothetical protein
MLIEGAHQISPSKCGGMTRKLLFFKRLNSLSLVQIFSEDKYFRSSNNSTQDLYLIKAKLLGKLKARRVYGLFRSRFLW